jgi:predicted RNase H-like HicB family nuclease
MKKVYPVILTPVEDGAYVVHVPTFDIGTQGYDMAEAIFMARDAIGLMGITMEDKGLAIPEPKEMDNKLLEPNDIVTYVDVDFLAYRNSMDSRSVRKNCTIPYWLNERAEKEGVNFSKVLQDGLIELLNISSAK